MDIQKFANLIAQRRKELGMTQAELGRQLGVTDKAVSKWERGLSYPDIDVLRPLAVVLRLNLEEILGEQYGDIAQSSNIHRDTALEGIEDLLAQSIHPCLQPGGEIVREQLFGVNLEHTRSCVFYGLSAQMLRNRKFAGKPMACSGHPMQWYAIGEKPFFVFDKPYTRHHALYHMKRSHECNSVRMINPTAGTVMGMGQHELALVQGQKYAFRMVAKTSAPVEVTIELTGRHGTPVYAGATISLSDGQWHSCESTLTCSQTDPDADLRITFSQQASLCIGVVSLLPEGHFRGMRRDVIDCMKQAGFRMLRWPGGNFAGEYNWLDGLLDVDMRAPFESCLGIETQPHSMGYDFHEIDTDDFLALCQEIGAQPFITINPSWNTAEENAAWVEYCNGDVHTPYGKLRAQRGHPEPHGVKFWSLGNEFGYGHMEGDNSPGGYSKTVSEHGKKMLGVCPDLTLCSAGPYPSTRWVAESAIPLRGVAQLVSQHYYSHAPAYPDVEHFAREYYACISGVFYMRDKLRQTRQMLPADLGISLDEWNVWYAWYRPSSVTDGMFTALALHMICAEGNRCGIALACHFEAVNEGIIRVEPNRAILTAQGQIFAAMKHHIGAEICFAQPDAMATSRDGMVTLTVVNASYDRSKMVQIPEGCTMEQAKLYTAPSVLPPSYFQEQYLTTGEIVPGTDFCMPPHSFLFVTLRP